MVARLTRRSRFLFEWDAGYCLDRPEQSLDAVTGHVATFSRASIGTFSDAAGRVGVAAHSQPRFQWTLNVATGLYEPGLLLDGARTNVALWSRDLTNAAWTKVNATAAKTQIGADGVANSATLLTATAANGTALQAITLASSVRYQSAYVKRVTGSGVVQMTTDNGTTWTEITVTAGWTRVTIPTQTLANPTVGFRLVTSGDAIAVDFVQNENGLFQTSAVPTTTVAVARVADALSFPFNAPPQAMTAYVALTFFGAIDATTNYTTIVIQNATGGFLYFKMRVDASVLAANQVLHDNDIAAVTSNAGTVASGNRVEQRGVLAADGAVTAGVSINGATEVVGTPSAANILGAAWAAPTILYVGSAAGSQPGYFIIHSIRIAAGVRSLDFLRAG